MEVVSAIIGPIVESLLVPVKKQLGYLFSSTKHVGKMNARMKQLHDTSIDVTKHMEENNIRNQGIPTHVPGWLKEVAKIEEDAERISSIENGCFNLKMRYRRGRTACKTSEVIEKLIKENSETSWRDVQRPLGKVKSHITSTSAVSNVDGAAQNHFKSRETMFKDALESLQQDQKIKVIALCGMGGVGKTTMMEQLKKTAEDKKMFDYVVKVVIGQQINMSKIQQDVAEYIIGKSLSELSQEVRADRLRIAFENLPEGKRKVLVILDDIWEPIKLEDIGLSPFPNGFKLLLTSRDENLCTRIAVEASLAFKAVRVNVMEELEAQNFFFQIAGDEKKDDQELSQLGSEIVRRCGFLPLAIKLIATNLKFREANVWRDTRLLLKNNNLDENIQEIVKISYDYIKKEEEKAIFMLCGLFPEDFDISIEELTRYAWGLRLLNEVSTLGEARDRTNTCVQNLKSANLLIDSYYIGCVKMHDLVLSFVLGRVSKGDHPWVINHGDISKLSIMPEMRESCKRISVTCTGMSKFPTDFRYPNISLLRLMNGDKSLKFPEDFYERMESLEVIAYQTMQFPLLPRSLEFCTKLQTLILYKCSLIFDCSAIGKLLNLEVLSFAGCGINYLPSAIGNMKNLKLLDLTDCVNLRIDDGVLKRLVKLEELYMRVDYKKPIRFTDNNRAELAEISEHLCALEVEFFHCNDMPKNMKFTKLERFKISVGRGLKKVYDFRKPSFKNELMLVTNKDELLESRMNELFGKTELLYLQVNGMNDLEEVLVGSGHLPGHMFNNLKDLEVYGCANLIHLFTVPFASCLMKLERLIVSECPILEVLVDCGNGGDGVVTFHKLKCLSLNNLPQLVGFCNMGNVIELPELVEMTLDGLPNCTSIFPENTCATSSMSSNISAIQPFFNTQVLIPKLEILKITSMDNLKEIWPYQVSSSDKVNACRLRFIQVTSCKHLVNLFPTNPMYILLHLEELNVDRCGSIEVLFDIDVSCVIEIEEYRSNLRSISVVNLGKLRELWRMKGESGFDIFSRSFQAVEKIDIRWCEKFVNVVTPTVTNGDVKALMNVRIDGRRPWEESDTNIELVQQSHEINVISKAEISEVYGNIPDVESSVNPDVEEVVSNGYDENDEMISTHTNTISFPHLDDLKLAYLPCLKIIDGGNPITSGTTITTTSIHDQFKHFQVGVAFWFLCQYSKRIEIERCDSLTRLFPSYVVGHLDKLKELRISNCKSMVEIFEIEGANDDGVHGTNSVGDGSVVTCTRLTIPRSTNMTLLQLPNLTILKVDNCDVLEYIFTSSTLESLKQLKELTIHACKAIQVIVKEDGEHTGTSKYVVFPRLKSLTLAYLPNLKGFFFGMIEFRWPLLENVSMYGCPQLVTFTSGQSMAPKLDYIHTCLGKHSLESGLNFHSTNATEECNQVGVGSWYLYPYSKTITISSSDALLRVFPSYVVGQLSKLEELRISNCKSMVEIFETKGVNNDGVHGTNNANDGSDDTCTTLTILRSANMNLLQLPKLTILTIRNCDVLEYIFTSSTLESLKQLKELAVIECKSMQMIVKEDGEHTQTSKTIVFPRLKSLILGDLPNFKGFFLGMNDFRWPSLEKVKMYGCPQMAIFTTGHSMAPKLNYIHSGFGKHSLECGLNFHMKNATCETHPDMINRLQFPLSISNLVEVYAQDLPIFPYSRALFPCNELVNLKILEKIFISFGDLQFIIEEVFEVVEGTNDDVNGTQSVVVFEKLKEVKVDGLYDMRHMWKSNRRIVLNFPNLTKVLISRCQRLGHVFTCCMVGSLSQLQELQISNCKNMEVIVKEVEDSETQVVFPCLRSITLNYLSNLKGFCLGKEAFVWPSLDTLKIKYCPKITVFTSGQSTTPKLKLIDTTSGMCDATEDPNSFIKSKLKEGWKF